MKIVTENSDMIRLGWRNMPWVLAKDKSGFKSPGLSYFLSKRL